MHAAHVASGGRYPVLRAVAILFMVSAVVSLIAAVYGAVRSFQLINVYDRWTWAGIWLASGFFAALVSVGMAELIKLLIDVERNMRQAAERRLAHAPDAASSTVATAQATATPSVTPGQPAGGHSHRWIEGEETAEGALLRGH